MQATGGLAYATLHLTSLPFLSVLHCDLNARILMHGVEGLLSILHQVDVLEPCCAQDQLPRDCLFGQA
jgi:hypothetical protein